MTEKDIRKKIIDRFGDIDFELIEFNRACDPVVYKCLNCNQTFTRKRLQSIWAADRTRFCRCYPLNSNSPRLIPIKEAQERLDKELGGEYEILEDKYAGWSKKSLVRHTLCGKIFLVQPRELLHHSHCPCYTINSKGEQKIQETLEKYNIKFEQQKRLKKIMKAPYDFYLPDYNLLIEFQGRQHYEPVKQFGGEKQFAIQQEIDQRKKQIAIQNNYDILYISYLEKSSIEEILVQRLSLTGVDSSESKCQSSLNEN